MSALGRKFWLAGIVVAAVFWLDGGRGAEAQTAPPPFGPWLQDLKAEAMSRGIRETTLETALAGVQPIPRVLELDRRQPEFTLTLWRYLSRAISDERVAKGRAMLKKHRKLLDRVSAKFGVQPRFLVAFWGLESNFGKYTGTFPVVGALATLAHDRRRATFFRAQLLAALKLIDEGNFSHQVKGSWAGAMGNHQFIPTTYQGYAYDFDGDGKRDLWSSLPDIFASAANYLSRSGWQGDKTWGREAKLPPRFEFSLSGLRTQKTLREWQALGVRRADGGDLPAVDIMASVILPAGYAGPAFLVYKNYRTILVWNRSLLYAIAVGHLADRIVGGGSLKTRKPANDEPMSRADVMNMQQLLAGLGFDAGTPDGVIGPKTRQAIRAYQKRAKLPADGYPSLGLIERLQGG